MTRRSLAAALVALLSASLVGSCSSNTPAPEPDPREQLRGITSDLAVSLMKGVSSKVGESLAGWGASAIGIGNDHQSTGKISGRIAAMRTQLSSIQDGIQALAELLKTTACATESTFMDQDVTYIRNAVRDYDTLLGTKGGWDSSLEWVKTHVDNLEVALTHLDQVLQDSSKAGSISTCATAYVDRWQNPLDEQAYFRLIHDYLQYYGAWQMQGLQMYVEARHIEAANLAGRGAAVADPVQVQQICISPASADIRYQCGLAYDMVLQVQRNVALQFAAGGAGYSDGNANVVQQGIADAKGFHPAHLAWVRDLNLYGADGCTRPLTSSSASGVCGGTVGTTGPLPVKAYAGQAGWRPARYSEWSELLHTEQHGGKRVSDHMKALGFQNVDALVVFTGEATTSSWKTPKANYGQTVFPVEGLCLLDTNLIMVTGQRWPFCDGLGGEPLHDLLPSWSHWYAVDAPSECRKAACTRYTNDGHWSYSAPSFASAMLFVWDDLQGGAPGFVASPAAWMKEHASPQFRWPVLDLASVECGVNPYAKPSVLPVRFEPRTSTGAYSMCGADMVTWINGYVPLLSSAAGGNWTASCDVPTSTYDLQTLKLCAFCNGSTVATCATGCDCFGLTDGVLTCQPECKAKTP